VADAKSETVTVPSEPAKVNDHLIATEPQPSPELQAEVLRLRNLAARTLSAEAELANLKSATETLSIALPAVADQITSDPIRTYLGQPVLPPDNLPEAYQRDGLMRAVQKAAQDAGIALKKLEIEDSEFPYLIGIVANGAADFEKLKVQLKQNSDYEYNGSMSSSDRYAFNITPSRMNPQEASQRVHARTMLRQNMLYGALGK
jgi:hypothetical protein